MKNQVPEDGSIAVIIINYNGGKDVIECIRSLEKQIYCQYEVIVVDNVSTDGSLDKIREMFPSVRIVETGFNAGWGIGCNYGIEASKSEFIALINNDAHLDERCLAEMVETIRLKDEYGSCASKILLWDDHGTIEAAGVSIYRDGLSVGRGRLQSADKCNEKQEVFCANDCCCLYRRKMIDEIGLYDPDFFIYADETDMGWRHQIAGWKCIYAPTAIAYHAHSRSAGDFTDFKAYHVERNRIYLCIKYFPAWEFFTSFFYSVYRYSYQLYLARQGKGTLAKYRESESLWSGLKVLLKAHFDACRKLPVMIKRRSSYRKGIKKISNKEIGRLFDRFGMTTREVASYE